MAATSAAAVNEIRAVLAQFQAGRDRRDLWALDAFMDLFSSEPGLEVIGTGGVVTGDHFVWSTRFTALLAREAGAWRFHQMQFSFATTCYPDVLVP